MGSARNSSYWIGIRSADTWRGRTIASMARCEDMGEVQGEKWRLLRKLPFLDENQAHAFFSGSPIKREPNRNNPRDCKTAVRNAAPTAIGALLHASFRVDDAGFECAELND